MHYNANIPSRHTNIVVPAFANAAFQKEVGHNPNILRDTFIE